MNEKASGKTVSHTVSDDLVIYRYQGTMKSKYMKKYEEEKK